ncbi:hypothetical protein G6O69_26435 [Pseudenhygromyxa sp. WMMC2535]|uniref:hypothetical protein n=1 Tax=Pseudenhygromyxa sp. WMMC2535 TaxID=2712867 RepID=UPI00155273B5|nr:hypothetical protein [Pseudenhygromyxa sp. WMMC2535]NVB41404.1 hypothetical protein [Pseudenhygromyxa sp. WMMC2535]
MCHKLARAAAARLPAAIGGLALASLLVAAGACAGREGWRVDAARTCERRAAPRLCVRAEPDYGHVLGLADVELLPGECAVAGPEVRGGLLRVTTRDRQGQTRRRWIPAGKGRVTLLRVDEAGRLEIERSACDSRPFEL